MVTKNGDNRVRAGRKNSKYSKASVSVGDDYDYCPIASQDFISVPGYSVFSSSQNFCLLDSSSTTSYHNK